MADGIPPITRGQFLPQNHRYQVASYRFRFDIVTQSRKFRRLLDWAIQNDLVRDVCDDRYSHLEEKDLSEFSDQLLICLVQKSPFWFVARAAAVDTASSTGKKMWMPCIRYPTRRQVAEVWRDKVSHAPFRKTHTMEGHTKWGTGYEDPALIYFCKHTRLSVAQVGTIKLPLWYVFRLGQGLFPSNWVAEEHYPELWKTDYLLISPDGVVGRPAGPNADASVKSMRRELYQGKDLLGMLEIKCISPFHHEENENHMLTWCKDMNKRQWRTPDRIPFVYITQMTLQAISGMYRLVQGSQHWMWFIRWSPDNYALYRFSYYHLVRLGVWLILWRYVLGWKMRDLECKYEDLSEDERVALTDEIERRLRLQSPVEVLCERQAVALYRELLKSAHLDYVELEDYPEFDVYREVTRHFEFKVDETDQVAFGLGHDLGSADAGAASAGAGEASTPVEPKLKGKSFFKKKT